jgi:predicted RNA binding protein YcfA (HicA-like mRNA interferase family)
MKAISGRELARLVKRRGWTLLRVNGSHHIYGNMTACAAVDSNSW